MTRKITQQTLMDGQHRKLKVVLARLSSFLLDFFDPKRITIALGGITAIAPYLFNKSD
jgi:hypothetical protein